MKTLAISLFLWIVSAVLVSADTQVYIFTGAQGWTDVVVSTYAVLTSTPPSAVSLSSCTVMQGDAADCYRACINPNGTLSGSTWMVCPR